MKPVILLTLALLISLPAVATTLETQVSLLIGFPDEKTTPAQGVLVVPGTVIPISQSTMKRSAASLDREERASAQLVGVAESLKKTLRLARIEVSYRQSVALELDVARELPAPAEDVALEVKLLGFNDNSASYEVQFFDRSTPIADTRVTIERGERAVIGGLDGEAAPYLFLVVEPPASKRRSGPAARTFRLKSPDGPLEGNLVPPRIVHQVPPTYTSEAKASRIQGVVIVQAVIGKDGSVRDVKELKGLPEGLTESAVEAVAQWRFEPATLDGEPVDVYYNLTVNFRLKDEKVE